MLEKLEKIIDDLFKDEKLHEEDYINYFALCEYFNEDRKFTFKHFKKLKKKLKREIDSL